ncbi:MAG: CDC48 family AAA ATPase [Chloroflexota bacterium]|nr:CDC48 family AAA ATPase [Chloroflexota bacterium]
MNLPERGTAVAKEDPRHVRLRVGEALPRDVGRGHVRVDPADMARLGVQVGDFVQVLGKRATAARVMPTYPQDRGKATVQMDGIVRENAQVAIGEEAQLKPTPVEEARAIRLVAITPTKAFTPDSAADYLRRALEGLPVTRGDRVRATLFGTRYQEFRVADTSPDGSVVVAPGTTIKLQGEGDAAKGRSGVTYEDIGGLAGELQRVREMVELPLKHPELFERLGIDPPRGVLLHGPPGTGKTLIARAVANETAAAFFHISGPEVIHKFYGESEAHLRAIFEKATAEAPSIIFIDEIDAIASKREEVRGDQQVERRVVSQLLALMDGLKDRGQVIVIAATNIPHVLDPALRRPGRFDREIVISVPDRNGRLQVLQVHTRGMPLAPDVSLERLADITHGFVGADLEALCREAAMSALRRALPQLKVEGDHLPYQILEQLQVTKADFQEALKEVGPSAIREVFVEVPDVRWEDVGGLESVKQTLIESVEWPLKHAELFRQTGARPPKGILLSGPPGTGKTLLAKAVATESQVNFIPVKGPALLSKWVGESERAIREVFRKARQASPCILFFDEIDALAPARGSVDASSVTDRVISQLLAELDGIEELRGVLVLAATNRPDLVDPALLRPGRFDIHVALLLPDMRARREIFAIHTRTKPTGEDIDLDTLATATEGLVGADIEAICQQAALAVVREAVAARGDSHPPEGATLRIRECHFREALEVARKRAG